MANDSREELMQLQDTQSRTYGTDGQLITPAAYRLDERGEAPAGGTQCMQYPPLCARTDESNEGQCTRWARTRRSSGGTTNQDIRCRLRAWETDIDLKTTAAHHACICLH